MKTNFLMLILIFFMAAIQINANQPASEMNLTGVNLWMEDPSISVTTVKVFEIKADGARCSYMIQGKVTGERGVCFSKTSGPVITGNKSASPGNYNNGTSIITGLKPSTTYFVRAYLKNGTEVIYGNELSFTTLPQSDKPKNNGNVGQKVEKKESNTTK